MSGFFTEEETSGGFSIGKRVHSCISCGLYLEPRNPKMRPYGKFKEHIMVIGEAPDKIDDYRGLPWQGKAGRLLAKTFSDLGIDLFNDCISLNAVNCWPKENGKVSGYELDCCRSVKVLKAIEKYKPDIIILLGTSAVVSLLGHRWKKSLGSIIKWRGFCIPDRDLKAWICPTFDPAYVDKMDRMELTTVWKNDLARAIKLIGVKRPVYKEPKIHFIDNLNVLDTINNGMITFDYETTGLKPQAPGHRIICASVAYDENNAYVFKMPSVKKKRLPFIRLLQNLNVDKIAANMKYENVWSKVRLKVDVAPWIWDTMLAAHVLDNRTGVTGLKFGTYVRLGVIDYISGVSGYLKPKNKGGNELNQIHALVEKKDGLNTLMTYNGFDSIYAYRIALLQMEEIGYDWLPF